MTETFNFTDEVRSQSNSVISPIMSYSAFQAMPMLNKHFIL